MTITEGFTPLPTKNEFDEADEHFDAADDTDADLVDLPASEKPRRGRAARASAKVSARTVRTILAKHAELAAARPEDVALLAAALGTRDSVDDLVAHILSTPRLTLSGTAELEAIVKAAAVDPFDAVAVAMSYEAQAKPVWSILTALGLLDGPRPSKDGDASVAIARAAGKFSAEHAARLDAVKDLTRKGN